MSKCNDEAFQLAQQHNQMEIYADIIGQLTTPSIIIMSIFFFIFLKKFEMMLGPAGPVLCHFMGSDVTSQQISIIQEMYEK